MNTVTFSIGSNDAARAGGLLVLVSVAATYNDIIVDILVFFLCICKCVTQLPVLDSTAMFQQHNAAL